MQLKGKNTEQYVESKLLVHEVQFREQLGLSQEQLVVICEKFWPRNWLHLTYILRTLIKFNLNVNKFV